MCKHNFKKIAEEIGELLKGDHEKDCNVARISDFAQEIG